MRPTEQQETAGLLGDARRILEREIGMLPGDSRLAVFDEIAHRLLDIEITLRSDLERTMWRRSRTRLRHWSQPRLTLLRHHPAEPLTVPTAYLRTDPPARAPRITVVTPSYRQGHFLERTLYSVVGQGYPDVEYVVQDGGSDDSTRDVLERYGPSLARWGSSADGGQADGLNRGFADTSGEIMAALNADDLLLPGALACVARVFAERPDVDVVYGHRILIDEYDGRIGAHVLPSHDDAALGLFDYVPNETLFWRRSAWERAGGRFDDSFEFALDWDLLLRLRSAGARMLRIPRFLGAFRVQPMQKSAMRLDVFHEEAQRLLVRTHGRAMTLDEAYARARPYLRRHVAAHNVMRLHERLPHSRSRVRTLPVEQGWAPPGPPNGNHEPLRTTEPPLYGSRAVEAGPGLSRGDSA